MEASHQVNWNSIIYREEEVHRTKTQGPFLDAKGFSTNLLPFIPPYHVIISDAHVFSFTGTISHVHGCAPKMYLRERNLMHEQL